MSNDLKYRLEQHKMWLIDPENGSRFIAKFNENLSSADLSSADLRYADLRYANLSSADLSEIKKDFFDRLLLAKNEAKGLYDYLKKGLVDGSSYESDCACFVGTVAKIAKQKYSELSCGLKPQASSPTEKWFLIIKKGDIPENNLASKIVCEWVEEFCKDHQIELPKYKIVSSHECPSIF